MQLNDEERVVRHQSAGGPHLRREKICRHDRGPMGTQERPPGDRPLTTGRDALSFQNARNCRASDAMTHVLQRTLNTCVTSASRGSSRRQRSCGTPKSDSPSPFALLGGESQRARRDVLGGAGRRSLPRDQFAMPSENCVGRDERRNVSQHGASEPVPQHCEAATLRIGQS